MTNTENKFWRWKEIFWRDERREPNSVGKFVAGVDVGSVSTQAVVFADGKLFSYSSIRTGHSSPESALNAINSALPPDVAPEKLSCVVGTGYGRVNVPFANRSVTEIACHARGANFIFGKSARTVLDMGGQDCKVIRCDSEGGVEDFLMNDKCAAGTGRGLEIIADILAIPIGQIGEASLSAEVELPPLSATCVLFARSEAMALLREGYSKNAVLAAYCSSVTARIVSMMRQFGVQPDLAVTGGISKNVGIVRRLEESLGLKILQSKPRSENDPEKLDPQLAGAIGAALFASET